MVSPGPATVEMLAIKKPRVSVKGWWQRDFEIKSFSNPTEWQLFIGRGMHTANRDDGDRVLVWRIRSAFADGFFNAPPPDAFFGNHCLVCGRPLTDDASKVRRIGPECAGTSHVSQERDVLWTDDAEIKPNIFDDLFLSSVRTR